eukprot:TRINITY_DN938_c0_g1_i1.p1 TRINITY_DN938_c0_g1~~TRINITY_DN938_c0_g1_i1.p1  ORF type:complete len:349 (-),score=70.52 TRINITY_DN938_c0_g1_i1:312-1358(-)
MTSRLVSFLLIGVVLLGVQASDTCPVKTSQDYIKLQSKADDVSIGLGWILVVINAAVWLPQIVDLFREKSAVGISINSFFLAAFTSFAAGANIVFSDWDAIQACSVIGTDCLPRFLPSLQTFVYMILCGFAYCLALYMYVAHDRARYLQLEEEAAARRGEVYDPQSSPLTATFACGMNVANFVELLIFWLGSILFFVIGFILQAHYGACSDTVSVYAKATGSFNSVGTIFQWLPQIILTYQLKHKGNLSLLMVLSGMLLDVLTTVYMVRLHENWATWFANVVDFVMCTILMTLVIMYERADSSKGAQPDTLQAAAAATVAVVHHEEGAHGAADDLVTRASEHQNLLHR